TSVFGGNWSANQEGSNACAFAISGVSTISTGTGNGYWPLGNVFLSSPGPYYQNVTVNVSRASIAAAPGPNLLANAYPDRRGDYNYFTIVLPSFGVVPFIAFPGALNLFGAITGGSGYANGTYYNVPMTGGTGTGRIVNVTVSGGAVTALTVVNPGTSAYL